ncbi:MAG: hypothetical protein ACM3P0_00420 [Acidobacteriota bacterium]
MNKLKLYKTLFLWMILAAVLPVLSFAQDVQDVGVAPTQQVAVMPGAGNYIVGIIAGVILAVAFQLILTNLSVASGLTMLSTVTGGKKGKHNVHVSHSSHDHSDESPSVNESIRTISSAFGIWTLLTASIALFFASWLATELSLTSNRTVGMVLGLVIWGLFYVAMMTIEVSAVSSLVGSLVRLAATGLRTAYNMTASIFSKSDEDKAADTAAKVAGAVREEIFGDADADDLKKTIQNYVNQLKPQRIDPEHMAMEFAKMLDHTEIRAIQDHSTPFLDTDTLVATLRTHGYTEESARPVAEKFSSAFSKIKEEAKSDKDTASKITDSALEMSGMSKEEAEKTRMQFEDYLRSTNKEELNPDAIKRDLERLFTDPKDAANSLKNRLSHIDRQDVARVIAQRQDISQEEAERMVDKVYMVIDQITNKTSDLKEGVISKLRNYMNSLDRPELQYEGVAHDVEKLFHDPKAGAEALANRVKSMDRDTIKAIIASRQDMSDEDAERIVSKIESARDSFLMKIDQMKHEIERRVDMAKQETVHQADEVRKTASTAAWWAFGTAVVSGIAAAIGGMVGV